MILGLAFDGDPPRIDLPDMPRGLAAGLCIRVRIRRLGSEPRQRLLELGTATGARLILETGDRPDALIFAQETPTGRRELIARGALPAERWVSLSATLEPDGDAELLVFDLSVARGKLGPPDGAGRSENFLAGGSAGRPFIGELSQLHIWRSPSPDYLVDGSPKLDSDGLWAAYALDRVRPMSETVNGVTTTYYRLQDAGKLGKHARSPAALASVRCAEPLTDSQVRAIRLVDETQPLALAPIAGLDDGLTMEAWVRSDELSQSRSVLRLSSAVPLALCVGGANAEVSLVGRATLRVGPMTPIDEDVILLSVGGVLRPAAFTHIAATVRKVSAVLYAASLYVQGQLVAEGSWQYSIHDKRSLALQPLFTTQHVQLAVGGTFAKPNRPGLQGAVAEVRLWSTALSRDELGAAWLTRARGDEPGLAAGYRLDELTAGCTRDLSPQRGVAAVPSGALLIAAPGLPLLPSQSRERARVIARGKLLRETLLIRVPEPQIVTITTPTSPSFPSLPLPGSDPGLPKAPRYQHKDTLVFDATIKTLSASSESLTDATLEVRIDSPLLCITTVRDDSQFSQWRPGQTYRLTVPRGGSLRLRFVADELSCPTLRVRIAGRQADLWTVVRPDEKTHRQLRTVTAAELQSPSDGRRSPLPAASSAEDAAALASLCNHVGRVLPPFPQATSAGQASLPPILRYTQFKNILGDAWNSIEDGVDQVGDVANDVGHQVIDGAGHVIEVTGQVGSSIYDRAGHVLGTVSNGLITVTLDGARQAQRLPKTASQLLSKTGAELDQLIDNAQKTAGRYGREAIDTFVASANSLGVATQSALSDVVHSFELVGTTLVNGVEGYFRVLVRGINEALAALAAVCQRVGAAIEEVLRYLAYLFNWGDFLAASDGAQALLEAQLSTLPDFLNSLGEYKTKLVEYLNARLDTSFLNQSLAALCGIRVDPENPVMEELDYVIEQVQRIQDYVDSLITSTAVSLGGTLTGGSVDTGALSAQLDTCQSLLPCSALQNPSAAISVPLSDLMKNAAGLSGSSGSVFDVLFDSILSNVQATISKGSETMRKRISLGALTDFIEDVILGGRDFTALRIVALCAAIPKVLCDKIGDTARSGGVSTRSLTRLSLRTSSLSRSTTTLSGSETRSHTSSQPEASPWEIWLPWSCSLVSSIFLLVDTVREFAERESAAKAAGGSFFQILCGFFTVFKGLLQLRLVKLLPDSAQPYATAGCALEATAGAWLILSPILRDSSAFKSQGALMNKLDVVIYGALGIGQLVTLIVPLAMRMLGSQDAITATCLRGAAYLGGMTTRALSAADNGDISGSRKKVTMAFIGVSTALDLADASYGQAIDARS